MLLRRARGVSASERTMLPFRNNIPWGREMYGVATTLLAIAITTSLGGCAEQRRAEAQAELQKQIAHCRDTLPGDTHYLDRANCDAPIRRAAMLSTGLN